MDNRQNGNTPKKAYQAQKPRKMTNPLKATIIVLLIYALMIGGCVGCSVLFWDKGLGDFLSGLVDGHRVISEKTEVIYNKDGLKVTYQGLVQRDDDGCPEMKLFIENNTKDRIGLAVDEFTIDEFTADICFYADIPAGKKSNSNIDISYDSMIDNDMTADTIKTAEFSFIIVTNNNEKNAQKTERIIVDLK